MSIVYLFILWLVFGAMAASSLLYRQFQNSQILGVTFSRAHARQPEVARVVKAFRNACWTVLLASAAAGCLLLLPLLRRYGEFFMLALVLANLLANWLVISRYQRALRRLKEEHGWTYPRRKIVTVDLNVSREKGRGSVSPFWVWLMLALSFAPAAVLLAVPALRQSYPPAFSLIGPLCQAGTVALYYQARNQHARVPAEQTETNLLLARGQERIVTLAATLSALAMLLFWLSFNMAILRARTMLPVIAPVILLTVFLLAVARWQQARTRNLEDSLLGALPEEEDLQEGQNAWTWGGFYHNPDDPRIIVPKRIAGLGWTINLGRPAGKAIGIGTLALIAAVFALVLFGGSRDYRVTVRGDVVAIDAAMYDMTIHRDEVVSVSELQQLPQGMRTNGFGGASQSYGHFNMDGYGACMLYVYNRVQPYIVVRLKGSGTACVILNGKTAAQTQTLYQTLSQWAPAPAGG